MTTWKKIITSGSNAHLNEVTASTGLFTSYVSASEFRGNLEFSIQDGNGISDFTFNNNGDATITVGAGAGLSTTTNAVYVDIPGTTNLGATPASDDEFLVYDANGELLKAVTYTNLMNSAAPDQNLFETFSTTDGGSIEADSTTDTLAMVSGNGIEVSGSSAGDSITFTAVESEIDHDSLSNFTASEHYDHGNISILAGDGLTGGGTITEDRTLSVDVSDFMTNGSNDRVLTATGTDTMNAEANLKFTGTELQVDGDIACTGSLNISSSGTPITFQGTLGKKAEFEVSTTGDFTIDADGDIRFDAGGADIVFYDDGTEISRFTNNSNKLQISASQTNADIALMPNGTGKVGIRTVNPSKELTVTGDISGSGYLYIEPTRRVVFDSPTNHTYIAETANDQLDIVVGGETMVEFDENILAGHEIRFPSTSIMISGSSTSTGSFGHIMKGGVDWDTAVSASAAAEGFSSGDITGVTAGNGLSGGGTSGDVEVELKNNASLTDNYILKWDSTDTQLTNSLIVDDGTNVTIGGNLVINGDTTTISTSTLEVGDAFIFTATGSAASNVDGGLIVQSGSSVDSGSAIFHDISAQRWGVANDVASTTTTIGGTDSSKKRGNITTVNALNLSGAAPSTVYVGVGEMQIDTSNEDIWILTSA